MTSLPDVINDPFLSPAEKEEAVAEEILGVSCVLLWQHGRSGEAALLMDTQKINISWKHVQDPWTEQWVEVCSAHVDVPPYQLERWTDELTASITETIRDVAARYERSLYEVVVRAALPKIETDWREKLGPRLAEPAYSNQAHRLREPKPLLSEDGLAFTNDAEHRMYQAFKRAQGRLPDSANLVIFPLPSGRVRVGSTWTPDFLVTYRKRAGIVEVDGGHHRGRYAADVSRDDVFRDGGISYVGRIAAEDTRDEGELDTWVDKFLLRLAD